MHCNPTAIKYKYQKSKSLPGQWRIERCLSPFPVVLGHTSANAVKATAGGRGWSTGNSACLNINILRYINTNN